MADQWHGADLMSGITQALFMQSSGITVVGRAAAGASASSTTFTINYPAGTQDGDLVVVFFATGLNSATITCSAATQILNTVYSGVTVALFRKTVSGESSITATFSSSSGTTGASIAVFRNGAYSANAVTAPTASSIDPPSVSASAGNVVATFGVESITTTSITNATETGYDVAYALATTTRGLVYVVGTKAITSGGTEDPPAYTLTGGTVSDTNEVFAASVVIV